MATPILMPKVDMVMEKGTFVEWLKQEGETIQKGDAIFVMMTDKSAIEVDAPASGILAGLSAKPDDEISVSQVVGFILQPGENLPEATRFPRPVIDTSGMQKFVSTEKSKEPAAASSRLPERGGEKLVRATPLARSLAREMKLDLSHIPGSGPRGRVYRADVERYMQARLTEEVETLSEAQPQTETGSSAYASMPQWISPLPDAREGKRVALKGPRAIISKRLSASAATVPHIHLSLHVDMTEAVRLRERLSPAIEKRTGQRVSFTGIIAFSVAHLLRKHPALNSSILGDEIIYWQDIHLGIATNLEDYLVVPVVREAQNKNLEEIVVEINQLVERARARKLQPHEMTGSTFTISNLGMMGIESFAAIINPPEAGILAVGKIQDTAMPNGKELTIRPMMALTLAVDHRVVDGVQAANFLTGLNEVLENPYLLI